MTHQLAIADLATELADPHQHREPIWGWTPNRHRVKLRDHTTIHPGLITQLHQAIAPLLATLDNTGARGVPKSTPPLQLDALDRYLDITVHATTWCHTLDIRPRLQPEQNIRALAGANHRDHAETLLADMRRWRNWAATMTGWQSIYRPRAWCPTIDCTADQPGTLRVNLTSQTAICTACRSWWDATTIGILGDYIAATNATNGAQA